MSSNKAYDKLIKAQVRQMLNKSLGDNKDTEPLWQKFEPKFEEYFRHVHSQQERHLNGNISDSDIENDLNNNEQMLLSLKNELDKDRLSVAKDWLLEPLEPLDKDMLDTTNGSGYLTPVKLVSDPITLPLKPMKRNISTKTLERKKKMSLDGDPCQGSQSRDSLEETISSCSSFLPNATLNPCYLNDDTIEAGVDESGRGPLFGRVYVAAVVLPKDGSFDYSRVKDSKKFHSKKKIEAAAEYIKTHAIAWQIAYADETEIDFMNILQATQFAMHKAIRELKICPIRLIIDGNYFNPIALYNPTTEQAEFVEYVTVTSGDDTYASVAAASILAKVARDQYIEELCNLHPELDERYGIATNKGYGAKKHMEGIKTHGTTPWHRKSFGPCKDIESR